MAPRMAPAGVAALLERLADQFTTAMARHSECVELEGFRLYWWPEADLFYRNVAVPAARPADWPAAVDGLVRRFAALGREPRVEFIAELWPELPAVLTAAGFVNEMLAPVMVTQAVPPADGHGGNETVRFLAPGDPLTRLAEHLDLQASCFARQPARASVEEIQALRRALHAGDTLAATLRVDTVPVAVASLIGLGASAELAGVGTAPDRRRQGHAWRLCQAMLAHFFACGGELVWLSAGGDGSEHVYRKLGFEAVGTQVNYRLGPSPA